MNGFKTVSISFAVLSACLLIVAILGRTILASPPANDRIEDYLKLRQDVVDALNVSFHKPHAAVSTTFDSKKVDVGWSTVSKEHARQTLNPNGYNGPDITKYLIRLPIDPTKLDATKQHRSDTMLATEILNYYLRPLEDLGLKCHDSPMVAVGNGIQYSAKTWTPKDPWDGPTTWDAPVWVEGQVFFAKDSETMIFRLTVGGRFTNKGR